MKITELQLNSFCIINAVLVRFHQVSYALVIKRLFYTEFEAYWKKNDSRDLGRHMLLSSISLNHLFFIYSTVY